MKKKISRLEVSRLARSRKKQHRLRNWILGILGGLLSASLVLGAVFYLKTKNVLDMAYDHENQVAMQKGEFNGKNEFAVLLLGTDTGALNRREKAGNTDTIILTVVNPRKKCYTLMSFPRDTAAQMIGAKDFRMQKLNAAYPLGGAKMALASVQDLVNVPVKYYALVNMKGIMNLVGQVNGIKLRPILTFSYGGYHFKKGRLTKLSGPAALAYTRMRYDDPAGDYGRQKRQRQVLTSLVVSLGSLDNLSHLDPILKNVSGNLKTNLTFDALRQIVFNYKDDTQKVKQDYLRGKNVTLDGSSYQIPSTKELQRVSDFLRQELGLATQRLDNNETYQNKRNEEAGFSFASLAEQNYQIYDYQGGKDQ